MKSIVRAPSPNVGRTALLAVVAGLSTFGCSSAPQQRNAGASVDAGEDPATPRASSPALRDHAPGDAGLGAGSLNPSPGGPTTDRAKIEITRLPAEIPFSTKPRPRRQEGVHHTPATATAPPGAGGHASFDFGGTAPPSSPFATIQDGAQFVAKYNVPGDAVSTDSASYNHGNTVWGAPVRFIFWGSWWQGQGQLMNDIASMGQQVLASPYLSRLNQYSCGGNITFGGAYASSSDPPSSYNLGDVGDFIWSTVDAGYFPDPQDSVQLFMVFMPQTASPPSNARGENGAQWNRNILDPDFALTAFVSAGDLDYVTEVFTHELVELITDPGPAVLTSNTGWEMNRTINGGNQIGDACNNTADRLINGLLVQAYWSNVDNACVIPFAKAPSTPGFLNAGEALLAGQSWISADGRFTLSMQTDNNLVLYFGSTALWASGTYLRGVGAARAVMQDDGNLVVYDSNDTALWAASWSPGFQFTKGASLAIQNDGNLVIYQGAPGTPVNWTSWSCCACGWGGVTC